MVSQQSSKYHFNELEYFEKLYYVLKTSEIFPYDAEVVDNRNLLKIVQNTIRPEFTCNYDDYLMSDTLKEYQNLELGKDLAIENGNLMKKNT